MSISFLPIIISATNQAYRRGKGHNQLINLRNTAKIVRNSEAKFTMNQNIILFELLLIRLTADILACKLVMLLKQQQSQQAMKASPTEKIMSCM